MGIILLKTQAMEHVMKFTLSDISGVLGLLIAICALIAYIVKLISAVKAPGKELVDRVNQHEELLEQHEEYLKRDDERITSMNAQSKVIMMTLLALLEDPESVKRTELKKKINDYLINHLV